MKYYLLHDGKILARVEVEGVRASIFGDGPFGNKLWNRSDHVAMKVTGIGGDSNFTDITEAEAKKRFPDAFS